jgi:hypothetical protein
MDSLKFNGLFQRVAQSAVAWTWVQNGLRLTRGVLVLPLIVHQFSKEDLGMYYLLLSLTGLTVVIDFGFGPTIDRFISYAMGGAEAIEALGVQKPGASTGPNYPLLWQLLAATRKLYRYLTLALFIIMGVWGTYSVEVGINETSSPLITRAAWIVTLFSTSLDIYTNWWGVFLRGLNEVRTAARIGVAAVTVNCVLAFVLLICGAGLLSLPIAGLASSVIQRYFARRRCMVLLGQPPPNQIYDFKKVFSALWPNTWRLGIQFVGGYLTDNANIQICVHVFGPSANADYGLSLNLMRIASDMAYVWVLTKWPLVGQLQAQHDDHAIQRILWPRIWLQNATFFILACAAVFIGPFLLKWIGKDKEMLPLNWMLVLMLTTFLNMQFTTWGTLIATGNRLPYLWPTVVTNVLSLTLTLVLVNFTNLGLGALVLGPLLAGCAFNYWYWPPFAARGIGTTLFRFLFLGPRKETSNS